jgi:rhomboid protease GluP
MIFISLALGARAAGVQVRGANSALIVSNAIIDAVFGRKREGSVLCTSCGVLVGVNDDKCYNCGRRNPALWGFAPVLRTLGNDLGFTPFVFGLCTIMFVLTTIASAGFTGGISLWGPSTGTLLIFGASGAEAVFYYSRWWTVLSASWLHGGIIHFAVNMMSLRTLAPMVAEFYGPSRMIIIYTAGSIAGFLLSSVGARYFPVFPVIGGREIWWQHVTVGASASLAGLIGAVAYYGRRSGSGMIRTQAIQWITSMFIYGLLIPIIDNYAHLGGLAGGYAMARVLDPLKRERGDHIVIAVLCLAASVAAILYSAVPILIELYLSRQ